MRYFALTVLLMSLGGSLGFAAPKRLAILSQHSEGELVRAAQLLEPEGLHVDYFPLDQSAIAALIDRDFSDYDLLFVEPVGTRVIFLLETLERAKAQTRVLSFSSPLFEGNVSISEHPLIRDYWDNISADNAHGLLCYLGARLLDLPLEVPEPHFLPLHAFYHPDAPSHFETQAEFLAWYAAHGYDAARPNIGLSFYRIQYSRKVLAVVDAVIREIERQGANAIPLMRKGGVVFEPHFLRPDGEPLVDAVIFMGSGLNFSDYAAGRAEVEKLGVPLLWGATHYQLTAEAYRDSFGGMAPGLTPQSARMERDGGFEPIVIAARRTADGPNDEEREPLPEQIRWRVERALRWAALRRLSNEEKRLVLTFYSEGGGKANVGSDPDTYLNAQASILNILGGLRERGYDVGETVLPDRETLSRAMAERASNVGNWAPAELARRVAAGDVVTIPEATYAQWFAALPEARQTEVQGVWGPPPGNIMVATDERGRRQIVIPQLQFGKVALMPHPDWGYLQSEKALHSIEALPPHHQYIAFFLWMQREYRAHAWLSLFSNIVLMPGKAAGPLHDEWPSILVGRLPRLVPTELHGNGGSGNKRRAQALAISFMPNLVPSTLYGDSLELSAKLSRWRDSEESGICAEFEKGIREEAARLHLAEALEVDLAAAPIEALVKELERYFDELRAEHMPAGSHTFGEAPDEDTIAAMVAAMLEARGPVATRPATDLAGLASEYEVRIRAAPNELRSLLDALDGRSLVPGPIDDPIRNPDALPSGRMTYQFDSAAMPTREAWATGVQMGDAVLAQYREKHGDYPQKVAFVLWSAETAKNFGVNEAQILYLLGVRPIWNPQGVVIDLELIPADELGRPRIDVLATTSGAYRDSFLDKIYLIDKAVRLVSAETGEADNRVAAQSGKIRAALLSARQSAEQANRWADQRVFSTAPGAYSPSIQFLAASGDGWTGGEAQLAELYSNRLSHAYGSEGLGEFNRAAFNANLQAVEAATISRSSHMLGTLDHSMVAGYLGGLSLAVRKQTGRATELFITNLRDSGEPRTESLDRFFSRELRSRYFNPEWLRRMMKDGYDGARYMEGFAENLALWDATTPDLVTDAHWREVRDVYIDDSYNLGLSDYFEAHNPYAKQSLLATLVESALHGYWEPSAEELAALAEQFIESVLAHGPICQAGVCRNQALIDQVSAATLGQTGSDPTTEAVERVAAFRAAIVDIQQAPDAAPALIASEALSAPSEAAPSSAPQGDLPQRESPAVEVTGQALETVFSTTPVAPPSASPRSPFLPFIGIAAGILFLIGFFRSALKT